MLNKQYYVEKAKVEKLIARKNQKTVEVKEIRMSLNIDVHDFDTKANQAKKFLSGGDKVKASVRFRGREMAHPEMGRTLLERFIETCAEVGSVDKPPKMEGRSLIMFISAKPAPKANAKPAAPKADSEPTAAEENPQA